MRTSSLFESVSLNNRLGQSVSLSVYRCPHSESSSGKEYVFVAAPIRQASSVVGKNAEPIAFQLREKFSIDPRRFDLIEVREAVDGVHFIRWPFEWAGNCPLSLRCEEIRSPNLRATLLNLIDPTQPAAGVAFG